MPYCNNRTRRLNTRRKLWITSVPIQTQVSRLEARDSRPFFAAQFVFCCVVCKQSSQFGKLAQCNVSSRFTWKPINFMKLFCTTFPIFYRAAKSIHNCTPLRFKVKYTPTGNMAVGPMVTQTTDRAEPVNSSNQEINFSNKSWKEGFFGRIIPRSRS